MRLRPISASELDQTIVLLTRTRARDTRGQIADQWSDSAVVAARARPISAREVFADGAVQALDSVEFGIRYRAGMTSAGGVRWRGRTYELLGDPINVDGGNHTLELIARAVPV
jgi:SPP1 family predicted phage head-tail adaptor